MAMVRGKDMMASVMNMRMPMMMRMAMITMMTMMMTAIVVMIMMMMMAMVRAKDMMASVMNMRMPLMVIMTMMVVMMMIVVMMMMLVVNGYDNEEDCKDDYVETEQQIMNVGGLCIYAASGCPCRVTVCACNYHTSIYSGGASTRKPLHIVGIFATKTAIKKISLKLYLLQPLGALVEK